jgi:hypothetical protein
MSSVDHHHRFPTWFHRRELWIRYGVGGESLRCRRDGLGVREQRLAGRQHPFAANVISAPVRTAAVVAAAETG